MPDEATRIRTDVTLLQDDMSQVKEAIVMHETRFGNGREAMAAIRKDLGAIEEDIKPKAPDWVKIFLAGLTVVGILMGAQLWITSEFDDKATKLELEKSEASIKSAQKETAKQIGEIEKSQSAQETSIKNIEATQKDQGHKIDTILDRLPARRSNR